MCSANKTTEEWLSPTSIISTPQPMRKWPEDPNVNTSRLRQMYDRWTYAYMSSILTKGSKQKQNDAIENRLSQEDLFEVPNNMQASLLAERFRQYHGQKFDESEKVGKNKRLFRTLWHLAAPTFIPAGFCQLMTVVCQVSLPLLVREVLRVLENNPQQSAFKEGIPFAIAIFLCTLINSFANHRHRHLAMKSGVAMRAGTVAILYDHVLRLSPRGKQGLTTGEVTNLIATDTQKLYEVSQEGHLLWALPLSIALVTLSLFFVIGPTCLVGVAVLILCVPLASRVTSSMLRIRHKRVKMTDKRVNIVGGMLQGIKVTKLNGYEENYQRRVEEARQQELLYLRKELAVWAMTLVLVVISPIIATASTFTVYVLVDENNLLTPSKSFSVLLLFSALRFPINFAGRLLGKATQAYSAVLRIARFLEREARSVEYMVPKDSLKSSEQPITTGEMFVPLELKNATFFINPNSEAPVDENSEHSIAFQVSKFDFKVKKGEVLAVCGPVAAGKSSLINGIIDELPSSSETSISTYGRIAYVSQSPFILNATLRENILFGRPFDEDLYNKVIDACCLWADIELMGPAKDLVELGEHGRTISGGQQQRVSLARAAYAQPDLILLDDPLSALDAQTSKKVFDRLIRGPDSLLSNAAVVLVTHASHFLNRVDNILVIVDGSLKFKGSFESLTAFHPQDEKTKGAMEFLRLSIQENSMTDDKGLKEEDTVQRPLNSEQDHDAGKLILKEEREHGLSSLRTWLLWFTHAGGVLFLSVQICLMTLDRVAYVAVEYWLAQWSNSVSDPLNILGMELPPQKEGRSAQYQYLAIYSAIIAISVVATIMRSEWAVTGGSRAAKNVFSAMLIRVLGAPMYYFESTPIGRVLNRFTYDTEVIDVTLTQTLSMFMISCSWFVAGVTVMVCIIPWLAIPLTIITWIYWRLLLYYRCSGPDLQRLDALSRSPLQALLNEALDGAPTIRVYSQYATFVSKFYRAVDSNTSALLAYITSQRWLGCRIELLGTIIVLSATVLVISLNGVLKIDAGLAGLLILWSSNFTITLGFLVDTFSETEAAITAIERVDAMSCLPQEGARYTGKDITLPDSWPEQGELEFSNVSLRYRAGLPLALKDLSFRISPGERVGIVGRSGAGKSSITLALFRLVEIESGRILLDGVDLGSIGLADVRGRGMEIIPQNPFLVGGTLRECVDPFGQSNDDDILNALKAVRLVKDYDTLDVLNSQVEEGGFNFSVGERQLLNLARAMLSKPVLLCLDEATASIDGETDAFLQRMLRTKFSETTQITVAHRLETIMDFDKIIVMDYGCAAEIGSPKELLAQNGIFANLVDAAGPEGSRALRALVKQ